MKIRGKIFESVVFVFVSVISLTSCLDYILLGGTKVRTKISDSQFIYNIVDTFKWGEKDIIGFGEYRYNSYLLLVPRDTPPTLQKFYYRWAGGIDVDEYGFYFECKLNKESFNTFENGLDAFSIKLDEVNNSLIKVEDKFDYITYIVQWWNVGPKWQTFEYIMLDEENLTVIYAFSMSVGYDEIVKNARYNIFPNDGIDGVLEKSYSVYRNPETRYALKRDDMIYDISFLNYLF